MRKTFLFALIPILLASCFFRSEPPISSTEKLRKVLQSSHLSCSAFVAAKGTVLLSEGFGYANRKNKLENTPHTQLLIGSITKLLTATAILQLIDEGKIQETAPISAYLSWNSKAPSWAHQITIQDLLTHGSGLEEYLSLPEFNQFYKNRHTTAELLDFFSQASLEFQPGTRFEYSGIGYNLLGAIIEQVSNMSYGEYLKKKIFEPLEMNASFAPHLLFLSQVQQEDPNLALGYFMNEDGTLELSGDVNLTTAFAEASVISTTLDLYNWTQALFSQKIISEKSFKKMTHPYFETDEKDIWMGYGLFIDRTDPENPLYCHSGRVNGYDAFWCHEPKKSITVIVLSNDMCASTYKTANALLKIAQDF